MHSRSTIWASMAAIGAIGAGCESPGPSRVVPDVLRTEEGEVATLEELPGLLDPDYAWALESVREITTVGDGSAEPLVFDPTSALALRDGDLLVHDPTAERPLVLIEVATGTVKIRFGSRGQGPGELGDWVRLAEGDDDTRFALDSSNRQIHRYRADGTWLSSRAYQSEALPRKSLAVPGAPGAGYYVETWRGEAGRWHRSLDRLGLADLEPRPLIVLPEPPPRSEPGRIQTGRTLWAAMPGGIVTMWSDRPVVRVHDPGGELLRELRLPLTRREISARDIEEQVAHYGSIANTLSPGPSALTNELYAVNDTVFGMFVSGLWRAAEDPPLAAGRVLWRLFSVRGEYLGVVELEEGFRFLGLGRGTLWARTLDEVGFPILRELRLVRIAS